MNTFAEIINQPDTCQLWPFTAHVFVEEDGLISIRLEDVCGQEVLTTMDPAVAAQIACALIRAASDSVDTYKHR